MDWLIYSLCLAGFEASLVAGRKFAEGALFEAGGVNFSGKHFYYSVGITPSCPTKSYNFICLRNQFYFWNVHGIMNTLCLLQS